MCKTIGRCVAITFIVIGVLFTISGILTLVAPTILNCDEIYDSIDPDDLPYDEDFIKFCENIKGIATTAGAVVTSIGGILILVGILMLCCLRSKRPQIIQAAPVIATIPPGYPQYQNPLMNQTQGPPGSQGPPGFQGDPPKYPELSNFNEHK
ncbi:uncharacterized protein [Palaemon carinicauda]|uniref:uncharacterized protein n=1 Tax=Palaemon carinicauda TaxID=392227 RepID=UPI0035B59944